MQRSPEAGAVVRIEDDVAALDGSLGVNIKKVLNSWRRLKLRLKLLLILLPLIIVGALFPIFNGYNADSQGNSINSILYDGHVAIQGRWLYFSDNGGLYKMYSVNGSVKKLEGGYCKYLNVVGDWIYYSNGKICKVRTNGRDNTVVSDSEPWNMMVIDDHIYYNDEKREKLYMMDTNGSNLKQIDSKSTVIGAYGDRLIVSDNAGTPLSAYNITTSMPMQVGVFSKDPYHFSIYSMKMDGSDKKLLFETEKPWFLCQYYIHGDDFYYTTENETSVILEKYDMKTGKTTTVLDKNMRDCRIGDDYIYYTDQSLNLFKVSIHGSTEKKIASSILYVNDYYIPIEDWIIVDDSGHIYRARENASKMEVIGTKLSEEK
ncbi:MAG: DUF5050 domain-containing protein [Bacillota bacterium]|nr:DUF5050 domain-containing protein [Bacillota bacterium]